MKFFPQQTSFDNRDKSNAGIRAFRKSGLLLTVSFVREFLQNALDAILKKDQPVRLKFKIIEITKDKDKQYLKGIYKEAVALLGQSGTSKKGRLHQQ